MAQKNKNKRGRRRPGHDYTPLFNGTLEQYLEAGSLINFSIPTANPDISAKPSPNLFHLVEFCADIENAVRQALTTKHQQECFDIMLKEIAGASLDPSFSLGMRADVVQAVGQEFERRHLAPWRYFIRIKGRR